MIQFTFIGRTVNLAARIQALTRVHDTDVLLSSAVREALDPRFKIRELPATGVRGIVESVALFALDAFESRA